MFIKKEPNFLDCFQSKDTAPKKNIHSTRENNSFIRENNNTDILLTNMKAFLALVYMFIHVITLQLTSVIVKKISYISACQFSLIRCAAIFIFALPLTIYCNEKIFGEKGQRFFLILRGILLSSSFYLQFIALKHLQLIEVAMVMSLLPFGTAIVARILLKETLQLVQIITLLMTLCGVLLSLRLPKILCNNTHTVFDDSFTIGMIASVASLLCFSFAATVTRKLKEVHFSFLLLYMGLAGTIENAILNTTIFPLVQIECGKDQILSTLVGICGVVSHCCLTLALQLEPAGLVTAQKSSFDVLVTAVFQILFFSQFPDVYVVTGACIVIASLVVIGIRNWIFHMPVTSKERQKLKWILL